MSYNQIKSINQSNHQSINQSINLWKHQSINQSIDQCKHQSIDRSNDKSSEPSNSERVMNWDNSRNRSIQVRNQLKFFLENWICVVRKQHQTGERSEVKIYCQEHLTECYSGWLLDWLTFSHWIFFLVEDKVKTSLSDFGNNLMQ